MNKLVGSLLIVCIVAVGGQEYVVTLTNDQTPSSDPVATMIKQLAAGIQRIQKFSADGQDVDLPCLLCQELMTFAHNMLVDLDLLDIDTVQNFARKYAGNFWIPSGIKEYCNDYVDEIPDLIRAFADTYLNPERCAFLCPAQGMIFSHIVKKTDGA